MLKSLVICKSYQIRTASNPIYHRSVENFRIVIPWVFWYLFHIEVEEVCEDLSCAVAKLREGIATVLLVHVTPLLLLEDSDSLADLSDQAESICLQICEDILHDAVTWLMAEGSDIPPCLSEKAVLIIEEE